MVRKISQDIKGQDRKLCNLIEGFVFLEFRHFLEFLHQKKDIQNL